MNHYFNHYFNMAGIYHMTFQTKNPTFMMLTFGVSTNTLIVSGIGAFSFKFLMEQYNTNFDLAGYLIGKCFIHCMDSFKRNFVYVSVLIDFRWSRSSRGR